MNQCEQLFAYHEWANAKVLQHLRSLPEGILHQELQSVFPSVGATLAHMYLVDNIWLAAMHHLDNAVIYASLSDWESEVKGAIIQNLEERFSRLAKRYRDFLSSLENLDEYSNYQHPIAGKLRARYSDIVQHVVNHGTYHRGNITAMLRQMGYPGIATDYVWYLYSLEQEDSRGEGRSDQASLARSDKR